MGNFFHRTTSVLPETIVDIDSILNSVDELERHFHSYEKWFGSTGGVAPGSQSSLTGYRLTSNATANVFGTAVTIFNGSETPTSSGLVYFDFHRIHVINVQNNAKIYRIRLAHNRLGHTSWADAVAAGVYSDIVCKVDFTNADSMPIVVQTRRIPAGGLVWAAVATADAVSQWIDFLIGIHEYPSDYEGFKL